MVLLASAVLSKNGKALVSRQFVEMTRARIEGLLAAFPKLLGSDKSGTANRQHTFVETDSVRYVYQPLDQLYVLLVTTKNSNILEDLETLRLFSRVIPEYCRNMDEKDILENAFDLIFAFDEIVALGYRESVNLAQIRTFTEMDSHEERVFYQIKKTQEEEAKKLARDKAKELARHKADLAKRGGTAGGPRAASPTAIGPDDMKIGGKNVSVAGDYPTAAAFKEQPRAPARSGPSKALKLGQKKTDDEHFISQLKSEGQDVVAAPARSAAAKVSAAPTASAVQHDSVHIRTEEKLSLVMSRDGGLESMEVHGLVQMRISDPKLTTVRVKMDNKDARGAQVQTHPNLDKKTWQSENLLALKSAQKPFPVNNDIGVLKWRYQTTDEANVPLSINCWPSESGSGCDVNIEYSLESTDLTLSDVTITVPLPAGCTPVIGECAGEYRHDRGKNLLVWSIPLIDAASPGGTLEFNTGTGHADHFFPIKVYFASDRLYCDILPHQVTMDGQAVNFSKECTLYTERYEIV